MSSALTTVVSKVQNPATVATLQKALHNNIYSHPSRFSPNALKLKDGAIQRASVQPPRSGLAFKVNKDQVGVTKRANPGVLSSGNIAMTDTWTDMARFQNRSARIYMPQRKHLHCHPSDKTIGKYWVIDFETTSTYKSPLMQWSSASLDPFHSKGDNLQMKFPSVNAAVNYAEMMGWGYDVTYPKFKNHTYKNYVDNFKYKGPPKPTVDYD